MSKRDNGQYLMGQLGAVRKEFSSPESSKPVDDRLFTAECLIQTMWNLLQKNGISIDDLNTELDSVIDEHLECRNMLPRYACPKCGKVMKISAGNPFKAECYYCATTRKIFPYDAKGDIDRAQEEEANKANDPFAVYDPTDDLGF